MGKELVTRPYIDTILISSIGLTQASKRVHAVDVHGTATADTLSATSAECQGRVQLVLDSHQSIEDHRSGLVQVESVGLHARLFGRGIRVPPVNLEGLHPWLVGGSLLARI